MDETPPAGVISWLDDVSSASWIASTLLVEPGLVGTLTPPGFNSYVRVTMRGEVSAGYNPYPALRDLLVTALTQYGASHDSDVEHCTFGVVDVYGWSGVPSQRPGDLTFDRPVSNDADLEQILQLLHQTMNDQGDAVVTESSSPPTLDTGIRKYMLYAGPIESAAAVSAAGGPTDLPDLWWPRDRSWFVATDTDLDFLIVAGPEELTSAISRRSEIDAVDVGALSPLM